MGFIAILQNVTKVYHEECGCSRSVTIEPVGWRFKDVITLNKDQYRSIVDVKTFLVDNLRQKCDIIPQLVRINIDFVNSPADENPKRTSATAEGKKRATARVAKAYG